MSKKPDLLHKLVDYGNSDFYPFHMPGHKRQMNSEFLKEFPNPYSIDITEIDGFDNLHHPEEILKDSMDWAADIYGADRTYYLVNGSSCGILSAICGTTSLGGTILMSRNCHKSVYHGVILNHLKTEYIYPQIIDEFGLQGGLLPDSVAEMLKNHSDIQAVLVVSPTYDGIVSDIKGIAKVVHSYGIPLIVDEAHGAHFPFGKEAGFPVSALELGADIVIQSLHKTLPSFTQTAVMHVKKGYVDIERINQYAQIFQSSSPSYIFIAGMERCIGFMDQNGNEQMKLFMERLKGLRRRLEGLKRLHLLNTQDTQGNENHSGVFDLDLSKIIIGTRRSGISGAELSDRLREQYHLEMEMCGPDYITAITTVMDTEEGLNRLGDALLELEMELDAKAGCRGFCETDRETGSKVCCGVDYGFDCGAIYAADNNKSEGLYSVYKRPDIVMTIAEALDKKAGKATGRATEKVEEKTAEKTEICYSEGRISCEFIYLYPPGIPIVAPGEVLSGEIIDTIMEYKRLGLPVQGMEDQCAEWIMTVEND
jgi:arginine/lysine/ornithine decarboxylase